MHTYLEREQEEGAQTVVSQAMVFPTEQNNFRTPAWKKILCDHDGADKRPLHSHVGEQKKKKQEQTNTK